MSLSCLQVVSCCIPSSVFWFIRSRSSSLVINIPGSSPVPHVCSKHSPGETEALRGVGGVVPVLVVSLADGAGHVYKAALGQSHAHVPKLGVNGMPYTSTAASLTLGACTHGAVMAAQGNCGTQLFSGPVCHLLSLTAAGSFQSTEGHGDMSCIFSYGC